MRILILTVLFLSPLYFYNINHSDVDKFDSVKLKVSAPDRNERALTVENSSVENKDFVEETNISSEDSDEFSEEVTEHDNKSVEEVIDRSPSVVEDDQALEYQVSDLEAGWNTELKQMLYQLEPYDGESIHNAYLEQQQNYQATLESLLSEKQEKISKAEELEIDQLIYQLDATHQDKLKEILGAHYDAVNDHYDYFMEKSSIDN